ncbi:hypothetical protein DFH09DRAFT_1482407 [Mycena vulgaris]|nr:hypothetical protein DFH09DRAFT_1482407 [Mycena vulgaris]
MMMSSCDGLNQPAVLPEGDINGTHRAGHIRQCTKSGAHGPLSKSAIALYDLRARSQAQMYGLGLKEVWRVPKERHVLGKVMDTIGWPLSWDTYGGGWESHMADGLVSIGLLVGLDYKTPWLEPSGECQRMQHHPHFRVLLAAPGTARARSPRAGSRASRSSTFRRREGWSVRPSPILTARLLTLLLSFLLALLTPEGQKAAYMSIYRYTMYVGYPK